MAIRPNRINRVYVNQSSLIINRLRDLYDVDLTGLAEGSLLIYDSSANGFVVSTDITNKLDHVPGVLTPSSAIVVDANSKIDVINVSDITISNNSIVSVNTNQDIIISPNGLGNVNVNSSRITNALDPVSNTDVATKGYVDNELFDFGTSLNLEVATDSGNGDIFLTSETLFVNGSSGITTSFNSNNELTVILSDSGVVANTYGDEARVVTISVNDQGRVTYAEEIPIQIVSSQITSFVENVQDVVGEFLHGDLGSGVNVNYFDANNKIEISVSDATANTKGVAQFSSQNFVVEDGLVETKSFTIGNTEISVGSTTTEIAGLNSINVDSITIDQNVISSSENLFLTANDEVKISNSVVSLVYAGNNEPTSSQGETKLFSNDPGAGGSGIYFVDSQGIKDELISKTKAILYGLIF